MPNKHLEHLEDSIFDGRRVALAAVKQALTVKKVSVKWDGAPAIVFGTNPANGQFFVGTKSVFNKKKVLINYTYEDIETNHKGNVADILRLCLRHLPRISGIVQADWIGVGGGSVYCPNTVEYRFAIPINQQIILAPHTSYTEVTPAAEASIGVTLQSTNSVRFIDTMDAEVGERINCLKLAAEIITLIPFCKVSKDKNVRLYCRTLINKFIRSGDIPSAEFIHNISEAKYKGEVNVTTFKVWHKIFQLKQRLLDAIIVNGDVECYIDGNPTRHEGFVTVSTNPYKLVDRLTFSKANFNLNKNW
ncbi:gp183 [Synechococcus phage S-CAM8]|uniref:Gp183 n=1 Tax=Synechococcus phage S-CAM8 TaxID=754038 RepID=G8EY69_9CAUD|nr:gp183 [Synechococcus phage S-CAM8]